MKRFLTKLTIESSAILLMGLLGALFSLIFALIIVGIAFGAPSTLHRSLTEKIFCPANTTLQVTEGNQNPETIDLTGDFTLKCVDSAGQVVKSLTMHRLQSLLNFSFLLCFLPTFIPGIILMWKLANKLFRIFDNTRADEPMPTEET